MATPDIDGELIRMLSDSALPLNIRLKGWEYVLGLTGTDAGLNHLIRTNKYIPFICNCIEKDESDENIAASAYKCLINISNQESGAIALLNGREDLFHNLFLSTCVELSHFVKEKCYILSNLSSHLQIAKQMTDFLAKSEILLGQLISCYCSSNLELRSQYDFLTLVFANISRLTSGRKLLLEKTNFMTRILTFISSTEPEVRRVGVAIILRNCCLETDQHEKLLNDLIILPKLLLPLMDSQQYAEDEMDKLPIECQYLEDSKERDKSSAVRKILIQALTTLCYSKKGWDFLQSNGVYYVIRDLHTWESDESIEETIENLVTYLLVENYEKPEENENYMGEDLVMIQQLESDIVRDLPEFVV